VSLCNWCCKLRNSKLHRHGAWVLLTNDWCSLCRLWALAIICAPHRSMLCEAGRLLFYRVFSRVCLSRHVAGQPKMEKTSRKIAALLLNSRILVCQGEHAVGGCYWQISLSRPFECHKVTSGQLLRCHLFLMKPVLLRLHLSVKNTALTEQVHPLHWECINRHKHQFVQFKIAKISIALPGKTNQIS